MMTSIFKPIALCLVALISVVSVRAQDVTGLINPAVAFKLKNAESPWSFSFGVAQRDIIFKNQEDIKNLREEFQFEGLFLELNHYTSRRIGFHGKLTAGIRYRFINAFTGKQNETRFVEQYSHSKKYGSVKLAHRVILAQRLRERTTFRTRYRFSVELPLNGQRTDAKEFALSFHLESVWEFGKQEIPNFGQRLSSVLAYKFTPNTSLDFGLEYRHRDYTQNPYTQIFLLTGLDISL